MDDNVSNKETISPPKKQRTQKQIKWSWELGKHSNEFKKQKLEKMKPQLASPQLEPPQLAPPQLVPPQLAPPQLPVITNSNSDDNDKSEANDNDKSNYYFIGGVFIIGCAISAYYWYKFPRYNHQPPKTSNDKKQT